MSNVITKIDPQSGLLTVQKSGGISTHNFLKGGDLGSGRSATSLHSPYRDSVWVKRAIKHVSDPISSVPLVFYSDGRGGEMIVEDLALKDFWKNPGVNGKRVKQSPSKFIMATVGWYKLIGNAFWIMDDSWLDSSNKSKSPLILARPDRMTPICENGNGDLLGWRFVDGSGKTHDLIAEQVVHFSDWNPDDDIMGMPEWLAAKTAAESDYSAGQFAKSIMDNNGDRGQFVIAKGNVPSDEQREQIERMLRQKRELSRRGEYRAAFLTGDITVEDPSVQAVDQAFVTQRLENRHEVYIAFGVPPSYGDVVASYSVGSASDRYRLIEDTCRPMSEVLADGVEIVSERFMGYPVYAEFDWDEHSTMQEVRAERFDVAAKGWDRGIPWNVLSDHLRLRLPQFAGDNVSRVPFSMKTVEGESKKDKEENPNASANKTNALDDLQTIFKNMPASSEPSSVTKVKFEQDAAEKELWEMLQSKRKPWENSFEKRFNRILFSARAETLRNISESYAPTEKSIAKSAIRKSSMSLTFDLTPWMDKISEGMGEITEQAVIEAGGQLVTDELELEEAVSLPTAAVESVVQNRQNMLSRTSTEIWHEIRELIAEGIDAGDSIDELANRIRNKFNDISKARARRIAVTETAVAYEQGRYLTMKEAGITHKKWITASDSSVRDSHKQVNGEVIPIDEHFVVGDDALLHPADPNGSAEEVINCRCVSVADLGE